VEDRLEELSATVAGLASGHADCRDEVKTQLASLDKAISLQQQTVEGLVRTMDGWRDSRKATNNWLRGMVVAAATFLVGLGAFTVRQEVILDTQKKLVAEMDDLRDNFSTLAQDFVVSELRDSIQSVSSRARASRSAPAEPTMDVDAPRESAPTKPGKYLLKPSLRSKAARKD
jgi:hypothetical protein